MFQTIIIITISLELLFSTRTEQVVFCVLEISNKVILLLPSYTADVKQNSFE